VVRTAETIDPATRALLTEIDVPNGSGELLPGGYTQVRLDLKLEGERVLVPVNALLFRAEGLRAAVVDPDHRVRLQPLTVGRDYGTSLEVLSGLAAGDLLVLNPADSLEAGQEVRLQEVANPLAPPTASLGGGQRSGATAASEARP
jgi:multidrug efflux pump subunit AcrA (membrane-fusion protein)